MKLNEIKKLHPGDKVILTTRTKLVRKYVVQSVEKNQAICMPIEHGGGTAFIHAFSIDQWEKD